MKLLDVTATEIDINFVRRNTVDLCSTFSIVVETDMGTLEMQLYGGFRYDGRSGPNFPVSLVLPRWGKPLYNEAVLTHDAVFDAQILPFELANELFRLMLNRADVGEWKANLFYRFVNSAEGKRRYYTKQDKRNLDKMSYSWTPTTKHASFTTAS